MENTEEIYLALEEFSKKKHKVISRELDDYLHFVARTGDPVYQWGLVKPLFKEKLLNVITDFYETSPGIDIPPCPNVDAFIYETMKNSLLEKIDGFVSAPFTVQRICELLTSPRKQYSRIDKFMRAFEKNILVVSTREPGPLRHIDSEIDNGDAQESLVNGSDSNSDYNVDVDMEDMSSWKTNTDPLTYAVHNTEGSEISREEYSVQNGPLYREMISVGLGGVREDEEERGPQPSTSSDERDNIEDENAMEALSSDAGFGDKDSDKENDMEEEKHNLEKEDVDTDSDKEEVCASKIVVEENRSIEKEDSSVNKQVELMDEPVATATEAEENQEQLEREKGATLSSTCEDVSEDDTPIAPVEVEGDNSEEIEENLQVEPTIDLDIASTKSQPKEEIKNMKENNMQEELSISVEGEGEAVTSGDTSVDGNVDETIEKSEEPHVVKDDEQNVEKCVEDTGDKADGSEIEIKCNETVDMKEDTTTTEAAVEGSQQDEATSVGEESKEESPVNKEVASDAVQTERHQAETPNS